MQTSYALAPNVAIEGMEAEYRESNVIISKVASGLVPVGLLAGIGANPEVGLNPTAPDPQSTTPGQVIALPAGLVAPLTEQQFSGVPLYVSSRSPYDTSLGYAAYGDKDPVSLLIKGVVWVKPEATFAVETNAVWVRTAAAGVLTKLGSFAGAAGAGLSSFSRGKWLTATNGSGLAILQIW